jgi:hypothetical protein
VGSVKSLKGYKAVRASDYGVKVKDRRRLQVLI